MYNYKLTDYKRIIKGKNGGSSRKWVPHLHDEPKLFGRRKKTVNDRNDRNDRNDKNDNAVQLKDKRKIY